MSDYKKIILKKKIEDVIYSMYPMTLADIVDYKSTTVADELDTLASSLEDITKDDGIIDTKVKAESKALYNKIMGFTNDDTSIDEAYDTLKEVAVYLDEHGDVVQGFTNSISQLQSDLTNLTTRVDTNEKDIQSLKIVVGDSSSGLVKDVNSLKQTISSLGGDVEDMHTPQVYTLSVSDTTDLDAALKDDSFIGVVFGDGDVLVLRDSNAVASAYQYDSNNVIKWEALDGNVSADNIIIKNDITLAGSYSAVGNVTKAQNGTGTLSVAGKSLTTVLQNIFTKELQPTKTDPAVTLSTPKNKSYEVGTRVSPTYTATLSAGSYTYGPATGVTISSWSISDTFSNVLTDASGMFPEFTVEDTTNYIIKATATHSEGAEALTNLGNLSSPVIKIIAGTKTKQSTTITGYRKTFYGASTQKIELSSSKIRSLTGVDSHTTSFNITIPEGATQVIVAVPLGKTLKSVADTGAFGTDIVASFTHSNVDIEGANGYTAKSYNVYTYEPAAALGANTYKITIQ